jgi:HAD superfamily hydrolase (TIGR01509 family)
MCETVPEWRERHLSPSQLERQGEIGEEGDLGTISSEEMYQLYGELAHQSAIEVKAELDEITRVDWDVVGVIRELRKRGVTVVMLSNAASSFLRDRLRRLDVEQYFDRIFISSEMGVIKPGPEIFRRACAEMGVPTDEAVMVDDRGANIAGAEATGMIGILFDGDTKKLRERLAELGFLG